MRTMCTPGLLHELVLNFLCIPMWLVTRVRLPLWDFCVQELLHACLETADQFWPKQIRNFSATQWATKKSTQGRAIFSTKVFSLGESTPFQDCLIRSSALGKVHLFKSLSWLDPDRYGIIKGCGPSKYTHKDELLGLICLGPWVLGK